MTPKCVATCKDGSECNAYAVEGSDKCRMHRGTSSDGSSHDGNDWAAKHGAYSESFVTDFLRKDEIKRVNDLRDVLDTPEGAREDAKLTAAILKEQWRRTGDERFARRFESICETFGIAPEDPPDTEVDVSVEVDALSSEEKEQLDSLFDRDVQE